MRRVVSLFLPHLAVERLKRQERSTARPPVWRRSGVQRAAIEKLADADAYHEFGVDRREGLWKVRGLGEAPLPLFVAADQAAEVANAEGIEPAVALRPLTDGREVIEDYRALQLSLRAHPLSFVRDELMRRGVTRCADLASIRDGRHVEVAASFSSGRSPARPRACSSSPSRTIPGSPTASGGPTASRRSAAP